MVEQQENFSWQLSTSGPPWIVIDWHNNRHEFETRDIAMAFIERDKRMLNLASKAAMTEVAEGLEQNVIDFMRDEQSVDRDGEGAPTIEEAGREGNRRSRRRARRTSGGKATRNGKP